ncbi:MAG: RIP metalloprotease RseP [Acidobacteria bacterium]|nr:RIP metalloprotease RseP [Acidobacteriota bacterium]
MLTLVAFAFVLGVLVFVHELGHFVAAKRVGIRVLKFQLGFNPTLVSFRRGDTEYSIGALPLGGYVKMAGESPEEVAQDEEGRVALRSDEFLSKTKWERFQVLIMGPVMNLLTAVALTALVLYQGTAVPVYEDQVPVVGAVAGDSPAAQAGVRPGDRILSVAGHDVDTWEKFTIAIGTRPDREVRLGILRDGREISALVTPSSDNRFGIGDIGVMPDVHPHIGAVNPGEPAAQAGLEPGDLVVAVEGKPIIFSFQLRDAIASRPETPMRMTVMRDGAERQITVTPARAGGIGRLGIMIADATRSYQPGPFEAVWMGAERNVQGAGLIFQTLWGLVTRETSPKQLMGPVAIAQLSGESAELGWIALASLMASLSLNLGLLNLLPIPVLDGGHIFIMALEGLARRDFSLRVKEKMLLAGFVLILMLMVTVIYNDLTRISWIERLMPWR